MIQFATFPHITVSLEPGLYIFTPDSATGKTYMTKTLRTQAEEDNRVFVYTYGDYVRNPDVEALLRGRQFELLLFDRYDMYSQNEKVARAVTQAAARAVVLLDAKASRIPYICAEGYVDLTFTVDEMEVHW